MNVANTAASGFSLSRTLTSFSKGHDHQCDKQHKILHVFKMIRNTLQAKKITFQIKITYIRLSPMAHLFLYLYLSLRVHLKYIHVAYIRCQWPAPTIQTIKSTVANEPTVYPNPPLIVGNFFAPSRAKARQIVFHLSVDFF